MFLLHSVAFPVDILSGKWCTDLFRKLHPKPKSALELKIALEKTWETFWQKKLSWVLERLKRVHESWCKTFWAFALTQKQLFSYGVSAVWNAISERQCLIASYCQVAIIISSVVLSILYIMQWNFPCLQLIEWVAKMWNFNVTTLCSC